MNYEMAFSPKKSSMKKETLAEREKQLMLLHQEILMKREALLQTSSMQIQLHTHHLDMETLSRTLEEHLSSLPNPRFAALKSDYWAMVRRELPQWKQSVLGKQSSQSQHQAQLPNTHHQKQQPPRRESGPSRLHARATK